MRDPYSVLGVGRGAADSEIKSAYRELAKKYHPDTAHGDPKAEETFQEISAAYDILKDKASRKAYDRGDIDASGAPIRRTYRSSNPYEGAGGFHPGQGGPEQAEGFKFAFGGDGGPRPQDIFADLFGGAKQGRQTKPKSRKSRGEDLTYDLTVSFLESVQGAKRRVRLPNGAKLDVKVPAGVKEDQQIRLKGQGHAGQFGGAAGDARITIHVQRHEAFSRDGDNIQLTLPLTVTEAMDGAKVSVPTVWGPVTMSIPAGSNSGNVLRLRGKGVPKKGDGKTEKRGDQMVTLSVVLPTNDAAFEKFVAKWGDTSSYDPRKHLEGL